MDKLLDARKKINSVDSKMAKLFEERMEAVREVAAYKAEHALPILDASREVEIIANNSSFIKNESIKAHYINFLKNNIRNSQLEEMDSARCEERVWSFMLSLGVLPSLNLHVSTKPRTLGTLSFWPFCGGFNS